MRTASWFVGLAMAIGSSAAAQEPYTVEPLAEAPPEGLPAAIRATLETKGLRVVGSDGKALAEVWVRKDVPATAKPAGPAGAVQFPALAEGTLFGALRFVGEGYDYRDQAIAPGLYTLRYGLQPVNGDHLGVSPFRDYGLLLPAEKDTDPAPIGRDPLEERSAEAAGTSHPAVLMLLAAEKPAGDPPAIVHDEAKQTWAVPLTLPLKVADASESVAVPALLVVVGAAMP